LTTLLTLAVIAACPRTWADAAASEASLNPPSGNSAGSAGADLKPDSSTPASIHGIVAGKDGETYQGVSVTLTTAGTGTSTSWSQITDSNGAFTFANVPAQPFTLAIISTGFIAQTINGTLHSGESYDAHTIVLQMASAVAEVEVHATEADVAVEQFHEEERQRVIGIIPNYFVTYVADAPPLSRTEKYSLAWRTTIDPTVLIAAGGFAAMQQGNNSLKGYGQGAQGYAKRFSANYADITLGTFLGGAVYPALFKQDPRYFYKGTGTVRSRTLYAIANAIVCKGDNGHWQFDYSGILGSLTAGGLANLYYPPGDRSGAAITFQNTGVSIAGSVVTNLLQEFFVQRLTPRIPHYRHSDQ